MTSNKHRTFLATTALDEFWDKTQSILFLGEWCKLYGNREIWKNLDYEVLTCPLIDQDPDDAIDCVDRIFNELLPVTAQWLNKIHQTSHSYEYWKIVIGPFLFTHIRTVYDRYHRLKIAYSLYPNLETIGLSESSFFIPLNMDEYYEYVIHTDSLNLQIITQLISSAFNPSITRKNFSWDAENKQRKKNISVNSYSVLTRIKIFLIWFLVKLRGSKVVVLRLSYDFGKKALHRLMWTSLFRILPVFPRDLAKAEATSLLKTTPDLSLRVDILNLPASNVLAKLTLETLVINMPMSFIENYERECHISQKHYPYFAKVVFGFAIMGDVALKLWIAKNKTRGIKQIGWQHGGGYGALKSDSIEFIEHKFSDFYVAWGLKNKGKVISAPAVSVCLFIDEKEKKRLQPCNDGHILWTTTEFTKYPCEVKQGLGANYYEILYHNWHSKVITLLQPNIFSKIVMRLRYTSWSDHWRYLQDEFPDLKIHKPKDRLSFFKQIWTAKLLLFDNLNTTHLYGLALNIPSILFWDEKVWTIRDEVKFYFDALRDVGIFHNTPESAANMINKVGSDPFLWWNSNEVQVARKQYCDYFVKNSKEWVREWKDILLSFLNEP